VDVLVVIVVLALAVAFVAAPLRRGAAVEEESSEANRRADLEAAKEAKYREIRDAELDYRTGKLSEADWKALDRELRGQAIAILREIDLLGE
jgi:flagellar biosynthesis/type III secretory pathway M-ring protein FliF/YscJ